MSFCPFWAWHDHALFLKGISAPDGRRYLNMVFKMTGMVDFMGTDDIISAKNILITPHLGASTYEASEGVSTGICRQVRDFLIEEKLP